MNEEIQTRVKVPKKAENEAESKSVCTNKEPQWEETSMCEGASLSMSK